MSNYSWSGTWSSNTYYEVNTFVKYENIAYISTNSFQGSTTPPPLDMSNWNVFVIGYQVPVTPTLTPTITPTPTVTPPPIFVPTCSLIFNSDTGGIYSYNSLTNTSTFLYDSGIVSGDIATTQNKLWLYSSVIHEYDITLSPWSITFNRNFN